MTVARRPARPDLGMINELVRQLGALMRELDLTEIEASVGGVRVRVGRTRGVPAVAPAAVPAGASATPVVETTLPGLVTIEAPMVGTFYRAPSPTGEPYVREGDVVKEGQILCIIEAMKLMNEIESKVPGRLAKILVENGQPVEYGQPLFLIEPVR